jgi:autotransporter translocation and assembly factor TamB
VALEAGNVFIHTFKLAHAEESLDISGALVNEQLQDVRVHLQRLDLQALRRLLPVPELVGDRATLQASLSGTFAEPRLQAEVLLEKATAGSPRQRLFTTLSYQDKQFESATRLGQAERDVLTLTLQLPVDLALTGLSVAQRLQEAPLTMRLGIERPDLAALRRWVTALPELTGTAQGEVTLQGLPHALDVATTLQVQRLRMPGRIEEVNTPLSLTASLVTAPTLAALAQALSQGDVALEVHKLAVRAPTVRAQLPGQGTPPQPILVDNVLVQADARLSRAGVQADLHTLQLQAVAFGLPRTALTLAGRLTPQQINLTSLHARLPQSEVRVSGTFLPDGQHIQATVDIPRLRLDELPLQFPPDLPPEVQGAVTIQGSIPAPQVTARLQYATAQVMADVKAQLQQPLPQYSVTLQVERFPIARLMPDTAGLFQVQLQVQGVGFSGPERRADLDLRVTAPDFALAPNLATRLRASVAGDAVQLTQLQVQSVPLALDARGVLSAARQVDLDYTATLGNLQALRDVLGVAMQAQGRLTGEVRGQLDALQTRGMLQLDTWSVADFQGKDMRATFSATGLPGAPQATLTARLPELQGPSLPASALDLQGAWQAQQGTFSLAVTAGPYEKTLLAGKAVLQEGMRLTLERLRLQRQDLAWQNAAPVEIVREAQGTLRLTQLLLRSGEQEISVRAALHPQGAVDGTVQIRQVHVLSTIKAFDPAAAGPDGRLAVDMVVRGALQQPEIDGTVVLTALRWQEQPLGDMRAQINLMGKTLRTDVRWQDKDQQLLRLFGTVNTGASTTLALQVQISDVDLARLKSLSPAIRQSAGALHADLRVTGTPQQPLVHGTMSLRDGIMLLAATGERYKDIAASLEFRGDRLEIQRVHVGSRSGALQVEGWVTSAGLALQQLDMAIQAEKFTALHTPDLEAMLTGNIAVRGSLKELEATGNITVPRARIRLGGILGGGPADVEPRELTVDGVYGPGVGVVVDTHGRTPVIQKQQPLPFLRTDITLEIPRNTWVQGTNTAVEMRGNMRVTKALEQPFILDGTVETLRGFASFYGKKFTVQEGKVVFPGTEEINPFLDVWVTHTVSGYDVSIKVGGKAKQPVLTLSSVPELPQADIVALLVVGKTTDRLTNSEQNSLGSQAQQLVGGAAANELEKTLGKPLGLDTIELEAGKEIGTGSVSVGRYVTQDIFLSYERKLGSEGGNTVGIEYSINRRLKLKGSGSDTGESALDLLWRHDY